MWSVSRIAGRDGVSKQAVSKKVQGLLANGLQVKRDGRDRIVAVNVAEYDHLRGRFGDPSKDQRPAAALPLPEKASDSYDEALRQKTWHEAERRRIELATMKGELIRVDRVVAAVDTCIEEIVRKVDRLPTLTDEIAAAVAREGSHGARVALKRFAAQLRRDIADALGAVAARTPEMETDEAEAIAA